LKRKGFYEDPKAVSTPILKAKSLPAKTLYPKLSKMDLDAEQGELSRDREVQQHPEVQPKNQLTVKVDFHAEDGQEEEKKNVKKENVASEDSDDGSDPQPSTSRGFPPPRPPRPQLQQQQPKPQEAEAQQPQQQEPETEADEPEADEPETEANETQFFDSHDSDLEPLYR
jgi:hypothetical protein